ncbi:MAG: hypothetical protein WB676_17050 [Bryobacteraceae bacterium]
MVSSTAKRVVAYRFDRQPLEGFVNPATFLLNDGVEILTVTGVVQTIPYTELKAVCFVSEPGRCDLFDSHPVFERRPRLPGLWTRFILRDGDEIDGVLPHNLADWPKQGYVIIPPRASAPRQRIFIPREALKKTELQGVIGTIRAKSSQKKPSSDQLKMFD